MLDPVTTAVLDAGPSQRRPPRAGELHVDFSPKLDDEIDNAPPLAVEGSDPFEMGFRQVQGVMEFSQHLFVRVARFRFCVVHLRSLAGLGALGPYVVSPRAQRPTCRARSRVHLVPAGPEAARASDRHARFSVTSQPILTGYLCLRHSFSHFLLIGPMGASWADGSPS